MTWWVLTLLDNSRTWTSLFTQAQTSLADHLFMSWSHYKPSRTRVYRTVRGTTIWCGYKYTWDTPHVVEQNQSGNTTGHSFGPIPLQPADHVWYYLWSIAGPYGQPCQGPLVHIEPPEPPMPSARVYRSTPQAIPSLATTKIVFDSVQWDTNHFWDPGQPDRLTIPTDGLYDVGACLRYSGIAAGGAMVQIQRGIAWPVCHHSHEFNPADWAGTGFSLHTTMPFRAGDRIELSTYHTSAPARNVGYYPAYSPSLWIRLVGPYPS